MSICGVKSFSNRRPLESGSPAWSALRSVQRGDLYLVLNVSLPYPVIKGLKLEAEFAFSKKT